MRWWCFALLLACRGAQHTEVHPDPAPSIAPKPPPPPPAAPVHHVKGDIDGTFSAGTTFVVAEPIVVTLDLKAKKALTYFNGGDQRNSANYPMHFAVWATDDSGAVVCDLVDKPAIMSFGGLGSDMTIAAGDSHRERIVINPACPALATPGKYRVTIHRRFAASTLTFTKPGAKYPLSCDMAPVHETLGPGLDPDCAKLLNAVPSITSELSIEILPFDVPKARAAAEKTLRDIGKDEIARHRIERHICGYVSCTCPKAPVGDADLIAAIASPLPKSFPALCP